MQYKYAGEPLDYSDFSSGRVFYSLPGHPAFPVRLASEIFQRCLARREALYGISVPCSLYDPCCGAAYHLSVLTYLHGECIREVIGSDIDENAVETARRNLGLLHRDGLDRRIEEISQLFEQYGKDSHEEALKSAQRLKKILSTLTEGHPLETKAFQANALEGGEISRHLKPKSVDIVFTDVPYGQHSHWRDGDRDVEANPLRAMLEALLGIVSQASIVAIASDKGQKVVHERYQRLEQFRLGKRRVVILKPVL